MTNMYPPQGWVGKAISFNSGTAFPASPQDGDTFYRTDLNEFYIFDGINWVQWEIENHAAEHEPGGADEVGDIDILNTGVNLSAHAARHHDGGADEIDVSSLAGALGAGGEIPETDGAAVDWVEPDFRYAPAAHAISHQSGGADDIKDMELEDEPWANNTGSGLLTVDTVGEDVDPGEICYMKADGKYWLADADAGATMPAKVMAMESISADAAGKLLHIGYFRHDAWTWALGNGEANLLFADTTPGAMVQLAAQPAGAGDQIQVVGYVVTDDIVFFNPSYEIVEHA